MYPQESVERYAARGGPICSRSTGFIAGFATKEAAIAVAEELAKVEVFVPVKASDAEVVIPLPGAGKSTANNPFGA